MLLGAWKSFRAFKDGKQIYEFGRFHKEGEVEIIGGRVWHMLPLDQKDSKSTIIFQFASDDPYFGLYEGIRIGSKAAHMIWMIKNYGVMFLMGIIYLFISAAGFLLFIRNRDEKANLAFALLTGCMGLYDLSRTQIAPLIINDALLWTYLELVPLYIAPFTISLFTETLFKPKRFAIGWWLTRVSGAYFLLLMILGTVVYHDLWTILLMFQYYALVIMFVFTVNIVNEVRKGNVEAKVFAFGMSVFMVANLHDIASAIFSTDRTNFLNHYGLFIMIMCLTYIIGSRLASALAVRQSLEMARVIQDLLLPKKGLSGHFQGYDYQGYYKPHGRMAGDWLNFWEVDENKTRLILGDVVGKGPHAALAVSAISAFIKEAKSENRDLDDCIKRINDGLFSLFDGEVGTTLSAVEISSDNKVKLFNCAGAGWFHISDKISHQPLQGSFLGIRDDFVVGLR